MAVTRDEWPSSILLKVMPVLKEVREDVKAALSDSATLEDSDLRRMNEKLATIEALVSHADEVALQLERDIGRQVVRGTPL